MVGKIRLGLAAWILFLAASRLDAAPVSGYVREGERPLAEVIVTDGLSFTFTDAKGFYSFQAADDAEFVYIVTPEGYMPDYSSGIPQFYLPLQTGRKQYDFVLSKLKGDPRKSLMLATADPQLDSPADIARLNAETLPDMLRLADDYADYPKAAFMAGDLTWDVYKNHDEIKSFARRLGMPVFPVIGNHDYDKYLEPSEKADFAHLYKRDFGPAYYAFHFGGACYIVLNNIRYLGHKKYTLSLKQGHQMEWLELLLKMVLQQDSRVFVVMHAPIQYPDSRQWIEGGEELFRMLVYKPFHAAVFCGHLHNNDVRDLGQGVTQHTLGSLGGYWWTSDYSGDGTPNGYKVIVHHDGQWSQFYKATGKPRDFQMQVYGKGVIADRPQSVCCKIWNWDWRWQVRWFQDGVLKGSMKQCYSYAPEYLGYLDGRLALGDYVPVRTPHFFSATPDGDAKEIRIEAEDPYGEVFTETIRL